jgi:hypothetical protein
MAGQFSDTGSKYALEALTGRSTLVNPTGNNATITAISANGVDVGANSSGVTTSSTVSSTGYTTLTVSANALAGVFPGQHAVISGIGTATALNGIVQVANVNYQNSQFSFPSALSTSGATFASTTVATSVTAAVNSQVINAPTTLTLVTTGINVGMVANATYTNTAVNGYINNAVVTSIGTGTVTLSSGPAVTAMPSGTNVTFNAVVSFIPAAKPAYIALCTAQPLDNNFATGPGLNTNGEPAQFAIYEYGATGYVRQFIQWSASTEPNAGTSSIFVGTGATIGGVTTTAPVINPSSLTAVSITNIVVSGSTGNPPYLAVVTTAAANSVGVGDVVRLGTGWTGGSGALNVGDYTVLSVTPSANTFTFSTQQNSPTAVGTFTTGTLSVVGPQQITYTTYAFTSGANGVAIPTSSLGTPTNNLVIGSTINIKGTSVASTVSGTYDQTNVPVLATSTNSVTVLAPSVAPAAVSTTATASVNATTLTVASTAGIATGQLVVAYGYIPSTAYVSAIGSGTVTVSQAVTTAMSTTAVSFASSTIPTVVNIASPTTTNITSGNILGQNATGFITYTAANDYKAGDTVLISGAVAASIPGINGLRQVYAANASQFTVYDTTSVTAGITSAAALTVSSTATINTNTVTVTTTGLTVGMLASAAGFIVPGTEITAIGTGTVTLSIPVYTALSGTSVTYGGVSATRVGAVSVGGLIQGPASGTLTFGAFTGNTGASITHAALVTTPTIPSFTVTGSTPSTGLVTYTGTLPSGLSAGHRILVTGLSPAGFNGYYTIQSIASGRGAFTVANAVGGSSTGTGTVTGIYNGELLAWWALDTPRTPATNDQVTVSANQLSLYVN